MDQLCSLRIARVETRGNVRCMYQDDESQCLWNANWIHPSSSPQTRFRFFVRKILLKLWTNITKTIFIVLNSYRKDCIIYWFFNIHRDNSQTLNCIRPKWYYLDQNWILMCNHLEVTQKSCTQFLLLCSIEL